ncbi:MAG TPA: hypothetical protein VFN94_04845 [Nitrospiria bacterium]|nr:hypothetical protein [Nitrospiria bacterium]
MRDLVCERRTEHHRRINAALRGGALDPAVEHERPPAPLRRLQRHAQRAVVANAEVLRAGVWNHHNYEWPGNVAWIATPHQVNPDRPVDGFEVDPCAVDDHSWNASLIAKPQTELDFVASGRPGACGFGGM